MRVQVYACSLINSCKVNTCHANFIKEMHKIRYFYHEEYSYLGKSLLICVGGFLSLHSMAALKREITAVIFYSRRFGKLVQFTP